MDGFELVQAKELKQRRPEEVDGPAGKRAADMGREVEDVVVAGGGHGVTSPVGRFSAHGACWGILSG